MQARKFVDDNILNSVARMMSKLAAMGMPAYLDWDNDSITWFFHDRSELTIDRNGKVKFN